MKCLDLLSKDRRHRGLNVESLRGRAQGLFSARVDLGYRLVFAEPSTSDVRLLLIGKEEQVYRDAERTGRGWQPTAQDAGAAPISAGRVAIAQLTLGQSKKCLKYLPLSTFLDRQAATTNQLDLTFATVEGILGETLPRTAHDHPAWWGNNKTGHVQAAAWLGAGWKTKNVRLREQRVGFVRTNRALTE
ncbi:MAG TPA: hypothetical protein VEU62_04305 [Bryobacterales bacterium]|nr:hypothetical protein [Bryobacterales bacterium]